MYWGEKNVIAVGGGKAGIGKSTFVANLGVSMAIRGKNVVVIDADTHVTNLHAILGVARNLSHSRSVGALFALWNLT